MAEKNSPVRSLQKFIDSSIHFSHFAMQGHYVIPIEDFYHSFQHFIKTGEQVLDEHAEIHYMLWQAKKADQYEEPPVLNLNEERLQLRKEILKGNGQWDINEFLSPQDKKLVSSYLEACEAAIEEVKEDA